MSERVMRGLVATDGGKSHSWLTATSDDSNPSAHNISVALESIEAILMWLQVFVAVGNLVRKSDGPATQGFRAEYDTLLARHVRVSSRRDAALQTPVRMK